MENDWQSDQAIAMRIVKINNNKKPSQTISIRRNFECNSNTAIKIDTQTKSINCVFIKNFHWIKFHGDWRFNQYIKPFGVNGYFVENKCRMSNTLYRPVVNSNSMFIGLQLKKISLNFADQRLIFYVDCKFWDARARIRANAITKCSRYKIPNRKWWTQKPLLKCTVK